MAVGNTHTAMLNPPRRNSSGTWPLTNPLLKNPSLLYTHTHAHFENRVLLIRGQTSGLSPCENEVCTVTLKTADMNHTTGGQTERGAYLITPKSYPMRTKLNSVLQSFAGLQVSLDPSGWADATRGKRGVSRKTALDIACCSLPLLTGCVAVNH